MGWTFYNSSGQQLRGSPVSTATKAEMEAASSTTTFDITTDVDTPEKLKAKWPTELPARA